ncbi:divergent polysaccharide deacetylase family protein [Dongia sedimenti]|uniref:Divergent polysaccharide deacetylase family protein n=1 Tax=Dongia sedimenti TaxID=3064282 RepID=A0ABU0YJZ9_9PROT|nr:divergent polysaccharide deacetylase family protein [Rhodospirillaceae bacterium R-7]
MAPRRSKKPTLSRRIATWRKLPKKALAYRPPHSSVFVIGLGIGLAIGLSVGVGLTWLDGRRAPETQVAQVAPPQQAKPVAPAMPPAYIEQTEPVPPEQEEAPVTEAAPPAVSEPAPVPQSAEPQPAPGFAPTPQPAEPGPAPEPAWLKNAVASVDAGNRPIIAIVLDDVGAAPADVPGALGLPAPVTLSIMTYAPNAAKIAAEAHRAGHEIMVHVPMEPINRDADPGKNALLTNLSADEIARRLDWGLAQFQGYVGINNHMGSKFTQNAAGMRVVLQALKERGLLFLDSRTIANSVGDSLAAEIGVTHLQRDVFLDDVIDAADIMKELARTEAIARKHGVAVAIGHPHRDTVEALREWIPEAQARGFVLVPISQVAKKRSGMTG